MMQLTYGNRELPVLSANAIVTCIQCDIGLIISFKAKKCIRSNLLFSINVVYILLLLCFGAKISVRVKFSIS